MIIALVSHFDILNVKVLVGAFNQEKGPSP